MTPVAATPAFRLHRAPNVPDAHALERLPKQHETPANLDLFPGVTAPRRQADAARRDVSEHAVIRHQRPAGFLKFILLHGRRFLARVRVQFLAEGVAHSCQPVLPFVFVLDHEHHPLRFFEMRPPRQLQAQPNGGLTGEFVRVEVHAAAFGGKYLLQLQRSRLLRPTGEAFFFQRGQPVVPLSRPFVV